MKNETLTAILNEKDKLSAYMGVGVDYYKGETGKSGADEVYIGAEPPTDPQVKLWVDTEDQSADVVNWNDVENKPNFATVAESGSYNDLTDKPVIPEAPDLTNYATKDDLANAKPDLTPYAKTADLSTVATTGSYEDLTNKPTIPEPYTLPTASTSTLGGVKVDGSTITIADGVISSTGGLIGKKMKSYNQPESEWTWIADWAQHPEKYYVVIQGVDDTSKECPVIYTQVGNNHFYYYWFEDETFHRNYINFTDNTLSQVESAHQYADGGTVWLTEENWDIYVDSYTLPVADYNTLGGVKAKQTDTNKKYEMVCIDSDARLRIPIARQGESANAGIVLPNALQFKVENNGDMVLLPASTNIGGVKADGTTTITDEDGTIHAVIPEPYTLPTASTTTLGGVKVDGTSITIADGVISSTQPTKTSELTNDSGFITNEYHDATKQNKLVAGDNITITDDGTISASHPARYIKAADVSGNTLNLYYNNDTSVVFTPTGGSGGGSGGVSGYAFSSTQTLTDTDKTHLKEIYTNKNIYMTIDSLTVVRIMSFGAKRAFVVVNTNGATSNQVLVYTVDIDGSGNVTSNTFTLFMSYYLAGNSSALSGDIITSENWSQYISAGGGDWQYTSSSSESNLYNAKEMVLYWTDNYQHKHQTYLNFMADFNYNTGLTLGTGWIYTEIYLDADDSISHPYIQYNGSSFETNNCMIYFILYKT